MQHKGGKDNLNPEVKALRDRICYDMDNLLPLHSMEWDYAKDVLAYIDMMQQMGYGWLTITTEKPTQEKEGEAWATKGCQSH